MRIPNVSLDERAGVGGVSAAPPGALEYHAVDLKQYIK